MRFILSVSKSLALPSPCGSTSLWQVHYRFLRKQFQAQNDFFHHLLHFVRLSTRFVSHFPFFPPKRCIAQVSTISFCFIFFHLFHGFYLSPQKTLKTFVSSDVFSRQEDFFIGCFHAGKDFALPLWHLFALFFAKVGTLCWCLVRRPSITSWGEQTSGRRVSSGLLRVSLMITS